MDGLVKVLHIGDREEYRMLSALLADIHHTDYRFTAYAQGEDVLDQILSQSFDAILLDYHWDIRTREASTKRKGRHKAYVSAGELLRAARSQGCEIPIIVMTDDMEAEVDREAIRAGASDYLIKGRIDSQLLERTVRYAIERKNAELKLCKLAHFDPLTNIPNRLLFRDRLEHALQRAERRRQHLALMYLDLDGFKQVNDKFGHNIGDKLLCSCAQRLVECMRKSDSVARIGGDEFTILLENADSTGGIVRTAEKVVSALSKPHLIENREIVTGCSIGIAVYPSAGKDADTLQRNADMAMYRAKLDPSSCFRFFTEAMNVEARRQFLLEADLQQAVEQQKFRIRYQPRIDLKTGRIVSLKSHLYWYHPQRGWLDGEHFIPLAENAGLINTLTQWEIQQVCQDWDLLRQSNLCDVSICINLSAGQLADKKLLSHFAQQRKSLDISPCAIEVEILESSAVECLNSVLNSLDDPIAGSLPINLKNFAGDLSAPRLWQQSNVKNFIISPEIIAENKTEQQNFLTALIAIARQFNKHIIVDGIDNKDQLEYVRRFGCELGQGMYFGETLAIDRLLTRFKKPMLVAS